VRSILSYSLFSDDGLAQRHIFGYLLSMSLYRFEWRADFDNVALNALHAEAFAHPPGARDWVSQVRSHSLGWVCAYDDEALVGFVNVAWDGALHAFILDTAVAASAQRHGVGTDLVREATAKAADAGCIWLHVDFEEALKSFYFNACGFVPTNAGLVSLRL